MIATEEHRGKSQRSTAGATALLRWLGDRAATAEIAERSGSALPVTSILLLEHLEATGPQRVSRIAARVSLISLTSAGRAELRRIRDTRCAIIAEALDGLDPESVATAATVLSQLERVLDAPSGATSS
jgi:hypothetical protein